MKKLIATIITLLMIFLTACGSSTTADVEPTPSPTPSPTPAPAEVLEMYYDKNETINLYVNHFNAANPDAMIGSDLCVVYNHHAGDHDNQIKFTRNDFTVVITNLGFGNTIELSIKGSREKTTDEYKIIFMQYARAYSTDLTDEKLEEYWKAAFDDIINSPEFDEFDLSLKIWNEQIEYMTIKGKIK